MNENNKTLIEQKKETHSLKELGWGTLCLRFLGAFGIFAAVSHIFNPYPMTLNLISPLKIIVYYLLGYLMQFMFVFIIASVPTVLICKISRKHRKDSLPMLLNRALVASFIIGGWLIYGGWYANRMIGFK